MASLWESTASLFSTAPRQSNDATTSSSSAPSDPSSQSTTQQPPASSQSTAAAAAAVKTPMQEFFESVSNLVIHAPGKMTNPELLLQPDKIWRDNFDTSDDDQLISFFCCNLSTSIGPCVGTLFVSQQLVCFMSDAELEYEVAADEVDKSHYTVCIPYSSILDILPAAIPGTTQDKLIHICTVDGYEFWFLGFLSYDQAYATLDCAKRKAARPLEPMA